MPGFLSIKPPTGEARKTLILAFPIILGELSQIFMGLLNTAMVGALSYKHLAAASLVMSVVNIPFVLGIGITISISQMVSLANGKRDGALVSHYLYNGFVLSIITALIISFGLEFSKDILYHLGQDEEVARLSVPYMQLMGWSVIPMLLFMALKQFTDGLEYTKTAMTLSLISIPLNFGLNLLLIFGFWGFPRLELNGAGWGSLISRSVIFFALAIVVLRHKLFKKYIAIRKRQWVLRKRTMRELLHIGIPSSLQIGMESAVFAVSGIIIGVIGAREQAGHQIALTMAAMTFMVSVGISQAASIRVSNALGRKDWPHIRLIGKTGILIGIVYGLFCAIAFIIFRHQIPYLFTKDSQVVLITVTLLTFVGFFQLSDSIQAVSSGLLRGIKDVRIPTIFIAIAYWLVGLPIGLLLAFPCDMGAIGIWIGFIVGLSLSAILLSNRFRVMSKREKEFGFPDF